MKIEHRNISDLSEYENNARIHSEAQIEQIAKSISEFGFTNPILIDEADSIIAGHGRLAAAKYLELKSVPCVVLENLTPEQKRAYVIADNKLALNAGWDYELLALEIGDLQALDFDTDLLGFSESELLKIMVGNDDGFDANQEWEGMPEWNQKNLMAFRRIIVHFRNQNDVDRFAKLVNQKILDKTKFIWFPIQPAETAKDKIYKSRKK